MKLTDINEIKRLAAAYGFRFSKSLGQNFLTDESVVYQTAEKSASNGVKNVIEVGPGFGVLTRELSKCYQKVVSVEIDRAVIPVLEETLADCENVTVLNTDILKININELIKEQFGGGPVNVAANLPYYITTPVITSLLESNADIASITVMVQKEVATRLTAKCGSEDCGAITAAVSYRANAKKLFDVPPSAFIPQPKVTSSVISLELLPKPRVSVKDEKFFFEIISAAFGQRRKQLLNSLSNRFSAFSKQEIAKAIEFAGLRSDVRGEKLTLENFAAICGFLTDLKETK